MTGYGFALAGSALVVFLAMVGVALLVANLWRLGGMAYRTGAAILLIDAVAVSGLAVAALACAWSTTTCGSPPGAVAAWTPAVAGVLVGFAADRWWRRRLRLLAS